MNATDICAALMNIAAEIERGNHRSAADVAHPDVTLHMGPCSITVPHSVMAWLVTGERGISSDTIVEHLTGYPASGGRGFGHPHDPADLYRCILLLDACPELHRTFIERMPSASPVWARLVEHWDDLCEQLGYELASGGGAPITYDAMRAVTGGGRSAAYHPHTEATP